MHMRLPKITQVASLIKNTAGKLKVQMVAAKHDCLCYLIVFHAYESREVRGLYPLCCCPCGFSMVLLVNVQLCALVGKKLLLLSSADEL